jgi:putative transposase
MAEKAHYPMRLLCRCLGISRSGYYAWATRQPSARQIADARLTAVLRLLHADSRQTYGRPRLCRALRAQGIAVGGNRVGRLMRRAGLVARGRRRFRLTTDSAHRYPIAPNRVHRHFAVARLNTVWAADVTAVPMRDGWCYLAVVLDLASRRVIGWAVRPTPSMELTVDALRLALPRARHAQRLVHHSDRGIQYASRAYQALLARHRIRPSMSRRADCWDNAPVESFFSTLKAELRPPKPWLDLHEAAAALAEYLEFYNHRRLHSTLDYVSPAVFESTCDVATG